MVSIDLSYLGVCSSDAIEYGRFRLLRNGSAKPSPSFVSEVSSCASYILAPQSVVSLLSTGELLARIDDTAGRRLRVQRRAPSDLAFEDDISELELQRLLLTSSAPLLAAASQALTFAVVESLKRMIR